jgi:hypothetical protein
MAIAERQVVGEVDAKLGRFGQGPWLLEPDRVEFCVAGLSCLIVRHPEFGSLLGFVGVPRGQAARVDLDRLDVHGGIDTVGPLDPLYGPPPAGQERHVWFGFVSGSLLDVVPWLQKIRPGIYEYEVANAQGAPGATTRAKYRDLQYMRRECERLARQIAKALG